MRWRHIALSPSAHCVLTWAPTRPPDRYRPKDMADLVSHEDIISTITRLIDAGKLPHLLLYGPPGTGKTSTILACAHTLYGKHFNSMVLNTSPRQLGRASIADPATPTSQFANFTPKYI